MVRLNFNLLMHNHPPSVLGMAVEDVVSAKLIYEEYKKIKK